MEIEVINYLLATNVDESDIANTIINNYFNVDQRRKFNEHMYKLFIADAIEADDENELPKKSEFESTMFKENYLDTFLSNLNILNELEQYLSSDEKDELEEWLIKEFDINIDTDD